MEIDGTGDKSVHFASAGQPRRLPAQTMIPDAFKVGSPRHAKNTARLGQGRRRRASCSRAPRGLGDPEIHPQQTEDYGGRSKPAGAWLLRRGQGFAEAIGRWRTSLPTAFAIQDNIGYLILMTADEARTTVAWFAEPDGVGFARATLTTSLRDGGAERAVF